MGLLIWLLKHGPPRTKRALRYANPGIVAFYWDGGAPREHTVGDISSTGAYVYAKELWCVGTIVTLTLQRTGESDTTFATRSITLPCRVARHGQDGIGFHFMFERNQERKALERFVRGALRTRTLSEAGVSATAEQGQALVELMFAIPVSFVLIILALNFGFLIYGWIAVENATRAAADYAVLSGSSAGLPPTASSSSLKSLINADLTHLPGLSASNPTACVQDSHSTVLMAMPSGACASYAAPPADTDVSTGVSLTYNDIAVDVTYTFTPLLPGTRFLWMSLPGLPSSIHRRTVMRII